LKILEREGVGKHGVDFKVGSITHITGNAKQKAADISDYFGKKSQVYRYDRCMAITDC